jgi:sugar transferase (PEP-CTERM/EpsH1 system associated)
MKPELLFVAHRIPYPPDKGDKIRSYHLLRGLAERYVVHLGTFVDDDTDWPHVEAVQALCGGECCVRPLNPRTARLRSARGIFSGEPLTLAYYRDPVLAHWVRDLSARRPLVGVFAFSSSMGQYAELATFAGTAPRVLDFCDVDSDKWRQYAATCAFPLRLLYAREARELAAVEARYVEKFDRSLVVSAAEAELLRAASGRVTGIEVIPNGVDTDYFNPALEYANPFDPGVRAIAFTGAMDYHANVDAVAWFAQEVLPLVREQEADATFFIIGSNPSTAVRALAELPGVRVVGRVPDMRPYLAHAAVVVAPLRLARGVQNKVLEALAMARPLVATPNAMQGIPAANDSGVVMAAEKEAVASGVVKTLRGPAQVDRGRQFVTEHFGWQRPLQRVCELFDAAALHLDGKGATAPVAA